MKSIYLKRIRVIISLLFFIVLSFVFLDISGSLAPVIDDYPAYLQFIPSLMKFTGAAGLAGAGFIIVLLITSLMGRVYCSSICPLGTLQDIIIYISSKLKKKKRRFKSRKPFTILRYSLLIITAISIIAAIPVGVLLLDPFSNFGRILTGVFRPLVALTNNFLSTIFESFGSYSLYPVEMRGIGNPMVLFPLVFLAFIVWMSVKYGRLYCNSVCPVGTLLGLFSKISLFKIGISESECKGCGVCEKVCKAGCIDAKLKNVDYSRCVSCFNCLSVCPSESIALKSGKQYKVNIIKASAPESHSNIRVPDMSKRDFISGTLFYMLTLTGITAAQNKIVSKKDSTVPVSRKNQVTPPGSLGIEHFTDKCTACHLCVSACPSQVLQPSFLEYGFTGMLMPKMDYKRSYCNFECTICGSVCPNGAILPVSNEAKKTLQIGKVHFVKDNCIVHSENTDCGACSEHCPTKAVTMIPYKGKLFIPETKPEICIGCGACEYACPAKPYKAIYIEGNPVHMVAKKPDMKKVEEKVDYKEDFPF